LQVVLMADYRKQVGPRPNTVNHKMDLVLAGVNAIKTKLGV
jgi:hypothetical protein